MKKKIWSMAVLLAGCVLFSVFSVRCMVVMPGQRMATAPVSVDAVLRERSDRLRAHIHYLSVEVGERNLSVAGSLTRAGEYVERSFRQGNLEPHRETYLVDEHQVFNIIAEIRGSELPEELLVIGAHYDSALGTPGADDNASGVAAMLELCSALARAPLKRTVRCVAFVNEEMPWFNTPLQGAAVHATLARERGDQIVGMFSLETLAYFSEETGSQHYPAPFSWFYPNKGSFIGFVGNMRSMGFVRRSVGLFRETKVFPSEGVAAPGFIEGVGWSDHKAFWDHGWPAVMVTDTAPFRNPHYHQATDVLEHVDSVSLGRVVEGLLHVVITLANE